MKEASWLFVNVTILSSPLGANYICRARYNWKSISRLAAQKHRKMEKGNRNRNIYIDIHIMFPHIPRNEYMINPIVPLAFTYILPKINKNKKKTVQSQLDKMLGKDEERGTLLPSQQLSPDNFSNSHEIILPRKNIFDVSSLVQFYFYVGTVAEVKSKKMSCSTTIRCSHWKRGIF